MKSGLMKCGGSSNIDGMEKDVGLIAGWFQVEENRTPEEKTEMRTSM
jgi:hypothetical protein